MQRHRYNRFGSLGHPCKFQRVSRLGSVTAWHPSSGRQPNCGVEQRAPPIFGRAAITLGIGPHSSFISRPLQCNVWLLSWDVVCLSSVMRVLWPNGFMDQDATWYGGRPWPKWHCIRWGPSSTHPKGHSSPPQFFSAHVYCGQTAAWIRMPHGMQIGRCWIEAIFSACHTNPNPMHWSLAFVIWANRWA